MSPGSRRSPPTGKRTPIKGDEAGVSLVLALVMLIVLSFIFLALASSSINGIANSTNLKTQRSIEYAASGAAQMAVQTVRYSGQQFSPTTSQSCLPGSGTVVINGVTMAVYCQQSAYNQTLSDTRVINFYACSPGPGGATCMSSNAVLYANVTFDDFPLNGGAAACSRGQHCPRAGRQSTSTAGSWSPVTMLKSESRVALCGSWETGEVRVRYTWQAHCVKGQHGHFVSKKS